MSRGSFMPDTAAVNWLFNGVSGLLLVQLGLWLGYQITRFYARRAFQRRLRHHKLPPRGEFQRIAAKLRQGSSSSTGGQAPSEEACVICFAKPSVRPVELLPCGHSSFCANCIVELWKYSRYDGNFSQDANAGFRFRHGAPLICPLCRQVVLFVCPNCIECEPRVVENTVFNHASDETSGGLHGPPKASPQSAGLIDTHEEDDVALALRYNKDFLSQHGHQDGMSRVDWWEKVLHSCIWWLNRIIHAKLLPFCVGLRIVLLHMTFLLYFVLPSDRLVHLSEIMYPSLSPASSGDTAGKLHTSSILQVKESLGIQNTSVNQTVHTQLNFKFMNVLEFPLLCLIYYADDILFVLSCGISIGHISNRLFFWNANVS